MKQMTKKILLIEDEVNVVSFIKKGLTEEDYDVSVAFDGKAGLAMFNNNDFDLVLLDIMLPELNGLEVCKEIRKTNTAIPVLLLTALGTSENVVLGLETGADDYLVKPFKFVELGLALKHCFAERKIICPQHLPSSRKITFTALRMWK